MIQVQLPNSVNLAVAVLMVNVAGVLGENVRVTLSSNGTIIGNVVNGSFGPSVQFLGIPFAKSPTEKLRFKPPVKHEQKWTEGFAAFEYGPACMQKTEDWLFWNMTPPATMSENCLSLNVFVPGDETSLGEGEKAVVVMINGFNFQWGSSQMFPSANLAVLADVIVVTMNYRLNVFGFLTTGNSAVKGNLGLLDQQLALKWVSDNIGFFGGDRGNITLLGRGAGGISASLQTVGSGSNGLFQRVVSMSGFSMANPLKSVSKLREDAVNFLNTIGCPSNDDKRALACLQGAEANVLLRFSQMIEFPTEPIIDGDFLTDDPIQLYREFKFHDVQYMAGIVQGDGTAILSASSDYQDILSNGITQDELNSVLELVEWRHPVAAVDLRETTLNQYLEERYDPTSNALQMLRMLTDKYFLAPTVRGLDFLSSTNDAFLYYFTQTGPDTKDDAIFDFGPQHMEDVAYLFGLWLDADSSSSVKSVSYSMIHALATFAKTGKPEYVIANGTSFFWPRYEKVNRKYIEFTSPVYEKQQLRTRFMSYWNELVFALTDDSIFDDDNPSLISRADAETILFILILVVLALLMAIMVMCANR